MHSKINTRKYFYLLLFISAVILIEWIGHVLTIHSVHSWYPTLKKPLWTPPSWVFFPVWTILYITIGISGWLVFLKRKSIEKCKAALTLYGLQLFLNLLWSYLFFFMQNPLLGLIDILLLTTLIFVNILCFSKIHRAAGLLLIPYFFWVCYASALNFAIWSLNK